MPWTRDRYPPAMERLLPAARIKAIEIANAMLAEGYEEGQAIRMAIAAAKRWACGGANAPLPHGGARRRAGAGGS